MPLGITGSLYHLTSWRTPLNNDRGGEFLWRRNVCTPRVVAGVRCKEGHRDGSGPLKRPGRVAGLRVRVLEVTCTARVVSGSYIHTYTTVDSDGPRLGVGTSSSLFDSSRLRVD